MRTTRISTDTITVQERVANVMSSTTLGPRVAVESEPIALWDEIKGIKFCYTLI